jgi:arabinogalactan endo-1,4-beta-galactosidase
MSDSCIGCQRVVRLAPGEIERILAAQTQLSPHLLVDDATYEMRLKQCEGCPDLRYGTTCRHCGCLVAVRAKLSNQACPSPVARWSAVVSCIMLMVLLVGCAKGDAMESFAWGADVSMLRELEHAGAKYEVDPIKQLASSGWKTFRLRLFVDPNPDFTATAGATQDLAQVIELARRVQRAGGGWILDLHYSDTWADPEHQRKPNAWKDLSFDQLERRVHDYTADVLDTLASHDLRPEVVQVGNEITSGMVFPDGRLEGEDLACWLRLVRLFNAGARAVRERSTTDSPIAVMLHLHAGGREGIVTWFVDRFTRAGGEFDCIGLSFYPVWGDEIGLLEMNMRTLAERYGKPIWVVETSYPSRPIPNHTSTPAMHWPLTPEGQRAFLKSLERVVRDTPGGLGAGIVWWYPEAIPLPNRFIWRSGAEALLDPQGRPLPAVDVPKASE